MPENARPEADAYNGDGYLNEALSGTDLWQSIDEVSPLDSDFIQSPETPSADVYVTRYSDVPDPGVATGHVIRVRAGSSVSIGGETIDMVVELRENYVSEASQGTLICSFSEANVTPGDWTTYSYTLTESEANSITDYTSLFLRITFTAA